MVLGVKDGVALPAHWHAGTPQSTGSQASTKSSGGSGPMGEPRALTSVVQGMRVALRRRRIVTHKCSKTAAWLEASLLQGLNLIFLADICTQLPQRPIAPTHIRFIATH